jgi:hypothetical protein
MRVSRALELGYHAPIHLSRLELRENLLNQEKSKFNPQEHL